MTALTKDRNTPRIEGDVFVYDVAAATKIFGGGLAVLDASGNAEPGSTATGKTAVGRAEEQVDNSAGAAGDKTVKVRRGVFCFENDGGDAIDKSNLGGTAYIVDDQTVAATDGTGTRSAAGTIEQIDSQGVWVRIK